MKAEKGLQNAQGAVADADPLTGCGQGAEDFPLVHALPCFIYCDLYLVLNMASRHCSPKGRYRDIRHFGITWTKLSCFANHFGLANSLTDGYPECARKRVS